MFHLHFVFRNPIFVEQFTFVGLMIVVKHVAYIRNIHEALIPAVFDVVGRQGLENRTNNAMVLDDITVFSLVEGA